MQSKSDAQLLQEHAQHANESAFREIVFRHTDLVYSAALRQVDSSDLARDVAQNVFIDLARKARSVAGTLSRDSSLVGWLYRATRFEALNLRRNELRRHSRERQAMEHLIPVTENAPDWERLRPVLDEAMADLNDADRDALLLRFFKNQDLREVGVALGVSDDAAQKRVSRAVERLRDFFAKRGVAVGASGLAVVISANAVQAAPVGLAVTISTTATLAGTAIATTATITATKAIAMTTLQKTLVTATVAALAGAAIYEARQASSLRDQVQTLQRQQSPLTAQIQRLTSERNDALAKLTLSSTNAAGKSFNWESVEAPDYKRYIANLRSAGCPEETIRDIIRADVHKLYEDKKKQVRQSGPKIQYWKEDAQQFIRGPGREMWMKLYALEEERNAVLRALGIEPDYKMEIVKRLNAMDLMLDFLPDEKKTEILRLQKAVEDRQTMRKDATDTEAIQQLQKELEDGVKRLLTPEEALQYQMRLSLTASRMIPHEPSAFELTESEFVAVFKLRKAFDDEFPPIKVFSESDAEKAKRAEAETQLKEHIKQTLGAERYADYEMALDHHFQLMFSFTKEANLGLAEAKQLYLLRRQAEEQAAQIRKDQALTAESRASARENIRQQTEKAIQTMLGEKGWQQFNRPAHNWWLDTINPRPVR